MDPILSAIDKALARKGLSDAAASKMAVGNPALIKNMRSDRSAEKRYSFQALQQLAAVLELECYFGQPRETGPVEITRIKSEDYVAIDRHQVELSAGPGAAHDDHGALERLAFRRDWLQQLGVAASNACLVKARGDSMHPTLHDGDLVLIDRARSTLRSGHVYAFTEDGEARVKRLDRADADTLVIRSDNPTSPLEFRHGDEMNRIKILGEVVWSAHTW